jgi:hypothetical protein
VEDLFKRHGFSIIPCGLVISEHRGLVTGHSAVKHLSRGIVSGAMTFDLSGKTKSTIGILAIGAILFVFAGAGGSVASGVVGQVSQQLFDFGKTAFILVVFALIVIVVIMNWHKFK